MLVLGLEVINMPGYERRRLRPWRGALSGEYAGFTKGVLRALMPGYQPGQGVNRAQLIGKTGLAVVESEMYQGNPTNRIANILPLP